MKVISQNLNYIILLIFVLSLMEFIFWIYKSIYKDTGESKHFYSWTHNHTACDNKPSGLHYTSQKQREMPKTMDN